MSKLILVLFSFILISCQVEKKSGGDDYIADHRNATNSFTIKTTQSGTFKTGDKLNFTLSFPSDVIVTGAPQLALEIGTTTRYANYTSGDGSKILNFEYTIQSTDNDNNGIRFLSINLNGGTLKFYLKEELTDCSTSIKAVHYKNIFIDNTAPIITKITHSNLPGNYYWNDELLFTVQYDEKVFITGSNKPTLRLRLTTGGWKEAQYVSGSGTQNLTFKYVVENTVSGTGIAEWSNPPLLLNGSVIQDSNGNVATNVRPATLPSTSTLAINGRVPKLVDVILPADGTYKASQHLDFALVFDRPVTISGTAPSLSLTVGTQPKQAELFDGTGTDTLVFRYTPLPGDVDTNGIALTNTITNSGSIVGSVGNVAMNTFTSNNNLKNKNTSKIIVDAILPSINRITRGSDTTKNVSNAYDNVWIIGQPLVITVEFNTKIDVNIQNGAPTLNIMIGDAPKVATYLTGGEGSNTMTFTYTVQEGDESTGTSIGISDIQLNNAVVVDESGTVADLAIPTTSKTLASTTVDGVRPTITGFTRPVDGYYRLNHPDGADKRRLDMTLTFSEKVNIPSTAIGIDIQLTTGTVKAGFTGTNNTNVINFRYSIPNTSVQDLDGVTILSPLNVGTNVIKDIAGNAISDLNFTTEATPNVIIDHTPPKVSSVTAPASGVYLVGNTLTFQLTFDETVKMTATSNYPRIRLQNLSPARYLTPTFTGTQEGTVFNFRYTIQDGDLATTAITLGNIEVDGSTSIKDNALNDFTNVALTFSEDIKVDGQKVEINTVTGPTAGIYQPGDQLSISIKFSEAVFVGGFGTPRIRTNVDGVNYDFNYISGDSTDILIFKHTITNEALRWNGLGSVNTITLNSGTIRDNNGIDAETSFSTLDLDEIKILPSKFLAWSQGSLTDIISNSVGPFSGSLSLNGANNFATNKTAKVVLVRMSFGNSSGSFMGINYNFDGSDMVLTDESGFINNLRANGTVINRGGVDNNEYQFATGADVLLEIEFNGSVSGTLFGTDFMGQIASILLLDSSLNATERPTISAEMN